jgi:hypothetical protein
MGWFGKRRQEERDNVKTKELHDMEEAIAVISARLRFLEALTSHLVAELPPKKRDHLLEQVREVVGGLKALPPPTHVPPGREQEFHNELSSAMQILIEQTTKRSPTGR